MKILVAIKQVPARDSQLKIASSGRWIEEGDLAHEINEPDAYALEAGLQLKEKHGGEVVALCLGAPRAGQEIRGGAGRRRRPGATYRGRRSGRLRPSGGRAADGGGAPSRSSGPGADGHQKRRSGLRANRSDSGGVARPAARHSDHGGGPARGRNTREART